MTKTIKGTVKATINSIVPTDDVELSHIQDAIEWIDSGLPIFRITKPDNPPKHLVSYFVLLDTQQCSILLIDHINAGLWLPAGGHVEIDEDPLDTVVRESKEELDIEADFNTPIGKNSLFLTVTRTVGINVHTDVSIWYVLKGSIKTKLKFDHREMRVYRWFTYEEVLATDVRTLDPHMHRFTQKLMHTLDYKSKN